MTDQGLLRPRHVAMISLGGIIGAGLFVGSSTAIGIAGPGVLLAYLLAGMISFLMMRMLGEMALARPGAGSFNAYVRLSLGPQVSFVTGWLYWYFWVIVVGAETVAGASLIHDWLPPDWIPHAPVWLIGLLLIAVMTSSNLMSVRAYGEFEFWFSLLKVGAIVLFILVGSAWLGHAGVAGHDPLSSLFGGRGALRGPLPNGGLAVLAAVPSVMFSLTGAEIASIAATDSRDPAANVARAARTVALRILLFYLASILVILCIVPWGAIRSGHSPYVTAMDVMGIPGGATLMAAVVLVAVLSCLNSGLYVTSRILNELALQGDAPQAMVVRNRRGVPTRAILAGSVTGFLAAIASVVSPDLVFAFLLNASGAVILAIYAVIATAQLRARSAMAASGATPAYRMWGHPWLSGAVIAAIACVLLSMVLQPAQRSQVVASLFSVIVVIIAARLHGRRRPIRSGVSP
ncbi:amino acid permease [Lichenicoccus sp.]|uniref:amino acid permease n=1 Tax=Lichenicoccus sp. TaxID=2781899 RepID=UPI003D119461